MKKLIGVEYDHKPNETEIYKTGVDVITKCIEIQKQDKITEEVKTAWLCDVERYTLLEYILVQQSKYDDIASELTQTQIGLAEVFEMLITVS